MLRVSAIVLFTLFLFENVCANACGHDNCETAIDIPLITKLNGPLKAELEITSLTVQLKELIGKEVKKAVSKAVNDLVENIADMRFQTAVDRLQNSSNTTMSTFRKDVEAELQMKMEKNYENLMTKQNISAIEIHDSLTIMGNRLDVGIEQLKSEVKTATEKVAITSCAARTLIYDRSDIIKFSDVKLSNGIGNVENFKSSGTFTCEKPGLYLVGVKIMSYINYVQSEVRKNGHLLSRVNPVLKNKGDNNKFHIGTEIMAVQLNTNDTLYITVGSTDMPVHGDYSCLTIIKVK